MPGDGAHEGVSADRALGTILRGDPPPTDDDRRSPDQMRAWLLECDGPGDYETTARHTGKLVLEAFLADPHLATFPVETEYDWPAIHAVDDWTVETMRAHVVRRSLYDELKDRGVPLDELGLTGFMWGWAANAARYCVELPPAPNPAIVTLGIEG